MFGISVLAALLAVVCIASKFNWDGFREARPNISFAIVIASFVVMMISAYFLGKHMLLDHRLGAPNTPVNCALGVITIVAVYVQYKLGAQEPERQAPKR